jgi:hypothetical protein
MMVVAKQGEIVQLRRTALRKWDHVIDLKPACGSATWHDATSITSRQSDSEPTVDRSTKARYCTNISGFVKDEAEERIVCEVASHRHRDGPLPIDLAALTWMGTPTEEGLEVHTDQEIATRRAAHDWVILLHLCWASFRGFAGLISRRSRHGEGQIT